ncbi:MAG: response regulator transcription factor [Thermoleophilia bacterium]|jgi:two-component system alkaline phosphatase synthesis response regulator PhoP/two-component system response regulator ResD
MLKLPVLIIEDEESIASFVRMYLEKEGYEVSVAGTGEDGLKLAHDNNPSVVLLDIMLPGIDGFEVCRRLRADSQVPIIMLTARDASTDKVVGLELGADDYITKPFDPRELVARVKSVLRRAQAGTGKAGETLNAGEITLDKGRHEVTVMGESVKLTSMEFNLLHYLLFNKGLVLTRQQLLEHVWGYDFLGDTRTVDVHINQLRKKLGDAASIETVWSVGYKLAEK